MKQKMRFILKINVLNKYGHYLIIIIIINMCSLILISVQFKCKMLIIGEYKCSLHTIFLNRFQFSSVTQSCPNLFDPTDCSTPGFPVYHQLLELTQTHVHCVSYAIQPSHPLSSPSPPAPNPSKNQGLFQRVSSSHQVAKLLELQLLHQSFQRTPRNYLL